MNKKNDLAFIIDCRMGLYEHQASANPNMPLRDLIYIAKEYQGMISRRSLYSSRLVRLPAPHFIVFYNEPEEQPDRKEMKLSDFLQKNRAEAIAVSIFEYDEEKELYLRKIDTDIIAGERLRTVNKSSIPVSNSQAREDGSNE